MKFNKDLEIKGQEAWQKARVILKNLGFQVFQIDWMGEKNGEYTLFEIKDKAEPFQPPPFFVHGLEIYQIKARLKFQQRTGIRTYLLILQDDKKMYGQYLDVLEKGEFFNTKMRIRIYFLENFEVL